MLSGRSLMYIRNRIGPNTKPCGTPVTTGLGEGGGAQYQVRKETLDSVEGITLNPIPLKPVQQSPVWHLFKSLTEIYQYHISRSTG